LANRIGRVIKCSISDMRQIRTGRDESICFSTVTYTVSTVFSAVIYFVLNRGGNLILEYRKLNWAPFAFGIVLVGLEAGWIYAYKAGWQVKYPGGIENQKLKLEAEGHTIISKGRTNIRYFVKDYETVLFELERV
jgi:hypothetical protein